MNRLTKKICLVLISSSMMLWGCGQRHPREDEERRPVYTGGGGGHGWFIYHYAQPRPTAGYFLATHAGAGRVVPTGNTVAVGRAAAVGGRSSAPSISARGGFGATGHAAAIGS